jgi:hypothetical protein
MTTSRFAVRTHALVVCAMVTAVMFAPSGLLAAGLDFLSKSAEGKFNDEDVRILKATALALLNDGVVGQSQHWANPNTTASGTLTVVKVFQSTENFPCKSLRVENSAEGLHNRATFPVCEVQGKWKIHSQARPVTTPAE